MKKPRKSSMILAAGIGSRLHELTLTKPKALIEINGEPLLKIIINRLKDNGFNHIVINVHHHADQIISFLKANSFFDIEIEISDETELLMDTGGAILKTLRSFSDSDAVLVHNVDIISDINLDEFYSAFLPSDLAAQLLCRKRESSRKLLINNNNLLVGWKNTMTNEVKWVLDQQTEFEATSYSGIFVIRPDILKNIEVKKCSMIDIFLQLSQTRKIECKEINTGYWFDLGKKEDFNEIATMLKKL